MDRDLLRTALACTQAGISIVPIDHDTKRPAAALLPGRRWKPYQAAIADEITAKQWCDAGVKSIAVVGGSISGGLLVFDFDAEGFYERWREAVGSLALGLPVQRTGGGGFQVFLRCPSPGSNDKLAWVIDNREKTGRSIAIETRGEGGYAVIAPSLHPSGSLYEWIGDITVADVPPVSQEHADLLLAAARALDEAPLTLQDRQRVEAKARATYRPAGTNGDVNVIGRFNSANPIEGILERNGYVKGLTGRFVRPSGTSESVSVKDGRSFHWSTNDSLNDSKAHDAFDVFTHFEHGGNVSAAVRAAAEQLGVSTVNGNETRGGVVGAGGLVDAKPKQVRVRIPRYRPFPVEVLPRLLARFVSEGAAAVNCDPVFLALPLLTAAGASIGNSRRALLKPGWAEPPLIWSTLVVPSGGGKSPALRAALAPIFKQQERLIREHQLAAADHKAALREWKDRPDEEGERREEPCPPPPCEHIVVSDATVEGLADRLNNSPRGVMTVMDELAGWFLGFNQYKRGGSDKQSYLSMYDAGWVKIDRKNAMPPTMLIPRAFVSIYGVSSRTS